MGNKMVNKRDVGSRQVAGQTWRNKRDIKELTAAGGEANTINSEVIGEPTGSDVVLNVVSLTQAEYNAGTPVATTFYVITDA